MFKVNYRSEAGLYQPVQRGSKPGKAAPIGYKRFKTAAAAIRFAIEQLPSYLLAGVSLEVGDHRYDAPPHRHGPYWHSWDITPALTNVRYRG